MGSNGRLLLGVALAVLGGGCIALGRLTVPPLVVWAVVAALGFTVAGSVLRPAAHVPADGAGRGAADFTVFAGVMIGLAGAALVGGGAVLLGLAGLGLMAGYARLSEPRGPLGQLVLAALVGLPVTYGAVAAGRPIAGVVPWILAAWLQLLRATVADVQTESRDRARSPRTLSTVLAIGFIPLSLVLPARAGYGGAYFLLALFSQLAVVATAARLIAGRVDGVNLLLKGAMVMGAVALVAGRVA